MRKVNFRGVTGRSMAQISTMKHNGPSPRSEEPAAWATFAMEAIAQAKPRKFPSEATSNKMGAALEAMIQSGFNPELNSGKTEWDKFHSYIATAMQRGAQSFGLEDPYLEICSSLSLAVMGKAPSQMSWPAHNFIKSLSKKLGSSYNRSTGSHNLWSDKGGSDRSTAVQSYAEAYQAAVTSDLSARSTPGVTGGVKKVPAQVIYHSDTATTAVFVSDEDIIDQAYKAWLNTVSTTDTAGLSEEEVARRVMSKDPATWASAWSTQWDLCNGDKPEKAIIAYQDKRKDEQLGEKASLWRWLFWYAAEYGPRAALDALYPKASHLRVMGSAVSYTDRFNKVCNEFDDGLEEMIHPGILAQELLRAVDIREHWLSYTMQFEASCWGEVIEHGAIKVQRLGSRIISVQSPTLRQLQNWYDECTRGISAACLTTTMSPEEARAYHDSQGKLMVEGSTASGGAYNAALKTMNQIPAGNASTSDLGILLTKTDAAKDFYLINEEFAPRLQAMEITAAFTEVGKVTDNKATWNNVQEYAAEVLEDSSFCSECNEAAKWHGFVAHLTPSTHSYVERLGGKGALEYVRVHSRAILASPESNIVTAESDKSSFTDVMAPGALMTTSYAMMHGPTSHASVTTVEEHIAWMCSGAVFGQKLVQSRSFLGHDKPNVLGETKNGTANVHGPGCNCCGATVWDNLYSQTYRTIFNMGENLFCLNDGGVSQGFSAHGGSLYQMFSTVGFGYPSVVCWNNDDGMAARRLPRDRWSQVLSSRVSPLHCWAASEAESETAQIFSLCTRVANYIHVPFGLGYAAHCSGAVNNSKKTSCCINLNKVPFNTVVYRSVSSLGTTMAMNVGATNAIDTIGLERIEGLNKHFLQSVSAGIAAAGLPTSLIDQIGKIWTLLLPFRTTSFADSWLPWAHTAQFRFLDQDALHTMLEHVKNFDMEAAIAEGNIPEHRLAYMRCCKDAADKGVLYSFLAAPVVTRRDGDVPGVSGARADLKTGLLSYDTKYKTWASYRYDRSPMTLVKWLEKGNHKKPAPAIDTEGVSINYFRLLDESKQHEVVERLSMRTVPYEAGLTVKMSYAGWHGQTRSIATVEAPLLLLGCKSKDTGIAVRHALVDPDPSVFADSAGGCNRVTVVRKNTHTLEEEKISIELMFWRIEQPTMRCTVRVRPDRSGAEHVSVDAEMTRVSGPREFAVKFLLDTYSFDYQSVCVDALRTLGFTIATVSLSSAGKIATGSAAQTYTMRYVSTYLATLQSRENWCVGFELTRASRILVNSTAELGAALDATQGTAVVSRFYRGRAVARPWAAYGDDATSVRTSDLQNETLSKMFGNLCCLTFTVREYQFARELSEVTRPMIVILSKAVFTACQRVQQTISSKKGTEYTVTVTARSLHLELKLLNHTDNKAHDAQCEGGSLEGLMNAFMFIHLTTQKD